MSTPVPPDHPAYQLSKLLSAELRALLAKTPSQLPLEADIYRSKLKALRDNWKYGFVVQWCYLFKNSIKLTDHFDVDSFEEELLQLNPPAFITRLKAQLIQFLTGQKISETYIEDTGEFEEALKDLIPQWLLEKFPTDEELDEFQFTKFDLQDQLDVYYQLIELANDKIDQLRKFIDTKFESSIEFTRPTSVHISNKKNIQQEYLILPDLRLYLKESKFRKINFPKTRKELQDNLDKFLEVQKRELDLTIVKFECITTNIYEFDLFINSQPKNSELYKSLKVYYEEIVENDIKRRKQELARQRQIKLQSLLVHRKRSSRLEEKEKRRQEEEEQERQEIEKRRREAALLRAAKRMKLRGDGEYAGLRDSSDSRELRYRRKQERFGEDLSVEQSAALSDVDNAEVVEGSEPAQGQLEELIQEETREPTDESTKEPAQEPSQEPAQEPTQEPAQEPADSLQNSTPATEVKSVETSDPVKPDA